MAWMVCQQYVSAVRDGYGRSAQRGVLRSQLAEAGRARAWLEGLAIDPALRASLVEPIAAVEGAFADLLRAAGPGSAVDDR